MGADMCLTMISHRTGAKIDRDNGLRYIKNLRLSDLKKIDDTDYTFEDIDVEEGLTIETDPAALVQVKNMLATCLDSVISNLDARDVATFMICGFTCYFTGGMTWGDDPSETFTDFNRMYSCGSLGAEVMKAAGFEWPPTGPDTFHIQEEASLSDV